MLKSTVLMAMYSIRSERAFCERLNYDLLFKWFLDMRIDDRAFDATTFTKNRTRLLEHEVAGIELRGTEVKAIRDGRINLTEAHVHFAGGEAVLMGCHIGPYEHGGYAGHEPRRPRRLLMHKRQIERLDAGDLDGVAALFRNATWRSGTRSLTGVAAIRAVYDDVVESAVTAAVLFGAAAVLAWSFFLK